MWFSISVFLSQQSQFVLHHQVWITHHFTLSWICKGTEQNKCQDLYSEWCLGDWKCGGGSDSHRWGCLQSRWTRHCPAEYPQPGLNWIKTAAAGSVKRKDIRNKGWISKLSKAEQFNRAVGIGEGERHAVTCRAALYSICSLRGAWRPWMFRSVEKLSLSLFSWNCKPNAQISFVSGV